MNQDAQLKLQSYLDGELSDADARQVDLWLAKDPEARMLLAELKDTTSALSAIQPELKLPESREFFWSKIQRQIEREEQPATRVSQPAPFWASWRKFIVPAGAMAAAMVALLATLTSSPHSIGSQSETRVKDSAAFTYRDYDSGATLVWFSYPEENELAQNDSVGTVR